MPSANSLTCRQCGDAITYIVRPADKPGGRTRTVACCPAVVTVVTDEGMRVKGRVPHVCENGRSEPNATPQAIPGP